MKLLAYRRWIVGALIVLTVAILAWYVLPLLPFGENHPFESIASRLFVIFLVLATWVGFEVFRAWRIRRKSAALVEGLSQGGQDTALSQQEAEVLRGRFSAALASLKGARFAGTSGSAALYQLPWYMFIGAPGSGKTTSLLNSGLRFPLADPGESVSALSGIGGTRNCDWWFTDQAVLIDTAGRYTTQDSNATVDQAAWKTFLGLLKRFRPRQPINGILVTLSVGDLFSYDSQGRGRYALIVRQRVEELQRELGLEFPVYVLVTKCDLIAGFNEFFSTFDAEQRAQVWGITFGFDLQTRVAENARVGFDKGFPDLTVKLNQLLFQRLQEERDAERRAVMYPFPQQFAAMGPMIAEFLEGAFSESKLQGRSIVRGLYFTSGTQQGAPIDRLLSTLSRSLSLSATRGRMPVASGASKAFFITRLLKEVVFPEAALAGFSEKRESALRRLSWGLMACGALLTAGFLAATSISYLRNRDALAATLPAAAQAREALAGVAAPAADDLPQLLDGLTAMLRVPQTFFQPIDSPPWSMRFGLYQGHAVEERTGERYRLALQQGLLPRLALQLERVMADAQAKPEQVYAALKTYLMLYEPKHMDQRWFKSAIADLWSGAHTPSVSAPLQLHLEALAALPELQVAQYHERSLAAVATARQRVAALPLADRAYGMLRAAASGQGTGIRLSEVIGPAGATVFERASGASLSEPIPSLFTKDGYRGTVRGRVQDVVASVAGEEDWVMGERSSGVGKGPQDRIADEVRRRYFDEYKSTWDFVLKDVRVHRPSSINEAMNLAQVLAQSDSPLRKLVSFVDDQTRISESGAKQVAADAAKEQIKEKVKQGAESATGGLLGGSARLAIEAALPSSAVRKMEADLEQSFAPIHRLAGDGKAAPEMDAVIQILNDIVTDLLTMRQKLTSGASFSELPPGLVKARLQADRFASPVSGAILTLTDYGDREASGGVKKEMKAGVGGAAAVCARSIPGRYPFNKGSAQDLGVQDFVNVFKSGGELDSFFNANLAQFVDKSGGTWRLKGSGEGAPPVSAGTLRQFQNAEGIRIAFLGGGSSPDVTADIGVVSGDGEITLEYNGSPQKMRAGAAGARVKWPGLPGVRLLVNGQLVAAAEGPWALFRLVDKGVVEAGGGGDKVRVGFATSTGTRLVLEVRASSSAFNPFRLPELNQFGCPRE